MSSQPFFPDLLFGWVFYVVLVAMCAVAAVIDIRNLQVPKWITLPMLAAGVAFNVARGGWMGAIGRQTWVFGANGPWVGALDGFLFALAGFAFCFSLFFVLWVLGACGGGDVKIFAALGAWVGPWIAIWILGVSVAVLCVLMVASMIYRMLTQGVRKTIEESSARANRPDPKRRTPKKVNRVMTYSLPLAVATAVVLLWFFRMDLKLAAPRPENNATAQRLVR